MDRVYNAQQRPFADIQFLGIAIRAIGQRQRHIGILHRDADSGTVLLLHLEFHRRLSNEAPSAAYLWIDPQIHPKRLRQVAAICRKVWRSNVGTLPFGFSPPNGAIDRKTGQFLIGPTRHGLTCATFVLGVFHAAGLQLVEYDSWETNRLGDLEWQEQVLLALDLK